MRFIKHPGNRKLITGYERNALTCKIEILLDKPSFARHRVENRILVFQQFLRSIELGNTSLVKYQNSTKQQYVVRQYNNMEYFWSTTYQSP